MTDLRSRIVKPTPSRKQSTLLVGPSGVGKTFQCGTLISGGWKTLFLSVEKKLASIEHLSPDVIPIVNCDYPQNFLDKAVKSDLYDIIKELGTTKHGFDAVCLDSGMRYAEELVAILKPKHASDANKYKAWDVLADKYLEMLKHITALADGTVTTEPVHVVITFGTELKMDGGRRKWQPMIDGFKIPQKISYFLDHILFMNKMDTVKGSDYVMYTRGTEEFDAKISAPKEIVEKVPPIIPNPNLCELLKTLTGEK